MPKQNKQLFVFPWSEKLYKACGIAFNALESDCPILGYEVSTSLVDHRLEIIIAVMQNSDIVDSIERRRLINLLISSVSSTHEAKMRNALRGR